MSYTLGSLTLPNPKGFKRVQIEVGATQLTLNGETKKDIVKRKEQFILSYENLTQAQVDNILIEYNLQTSRLFSVSESNLTISPTSVHIELSDREYLPGPDYREKLELILTEVS